MNTPASYAVISSVIQLQMERLAKRLNQWRVEIHSGGFHGFLTALSKLHSASN